MRYPCSPIGPDGFGDRLEAFLDGIINVLKYTITNMATVRNLELLSSEFNVDKNFHLHFLVSGSYVT